MGAGWDIERARLYANVFLPKTLESEMDGVVYCCYCKRKIPRAEAIVQEDMIMCQECAEKHSSTANYKTEQKK